MTLMFLTGWSFKNCRHFLEARRAVKLDEIIYGGTRPDGSQTQNNSRWIPSWEDRAMHCEDYRILAPLPQRELGHRAVDHDEQDPRADQDYLDSVAPTKFGEKSA